MSEVLATIVVVTFNSAKWLERQLMALEAQAEKSWRLIVIDNASRPEERPRASELPASATLIQSEVNIGFAAANNLAASHASSPYLALLNPDAFPEPGWLAALIATAQQYPEAAAIGSTQLRDGAADTFDGTGDVLHASGIAYRSNHGQPASSPPPLAETFSACAAAMLIRRDAFEAVGGFDERFFCYFEDIDLGFRLRLAGWRVLQSPDAVVRHVGGGSASQDSAFAQYHGARNRFWTFVKCMPAALFWVLLLPHLAFAALAAVRASLRNRRLSSWRGLYAGIAGVAPMWRSRAELQANRKASVPQIARALAWSPLVLLSRRAVPRALPSPSEKRG